MSADDYLLDPLVLAPLVQRRVKRGRKWMLKHGLVIWHPTMWFLISHGFVADGPISDEMLAKARAMFELVDPTPKTDYFATVRAKMGWVEGTKGRKSEPGRECTHAELMAACY